MKKHAKTTERSHISDVTNLTFQSCYNLMQLCKVAKVVYINCIIQLADEVLRLISHGNGQRRTVVKYFYSVLKVLFKCVLYQSVCL